MWSVPLWWEQAAPLPPLPTAHCAHLASESGVSTLICRLLMNKLSCFIPWFGTSFRQCRFMIYPGDMRHDRQSRLYSAFINIWAVTDDWSICDKVYCAACNMQLILQSLLTIESDCVCSWCDWVRVLVGSHVWVTGVWVHRQGRGNVYLSAIFSSARISSGVHVSGFKIIQASTRNISRWYGIILDVQAMFEQLYFVMINLL